MNILIVGNNRQISKDISFCLQIRYPIDANHVAENESEALKVVKKKSLNLIFIDSSIKNIDTLSLITRIREYVDIPLLVLIKNDTADLDRARYLEAWSG